MTATNEQFAQELARLSAAFVARLPRQVQTVSDDVTAWLSAPRDRALLVRLSHKLHKLKGAGSTFGCRCISDAARTLEQHLAALTTDSTGGRPAAMLDKVAAALEALRYEADRLYGESTQNDQPGRQV